MLWSLLVGLGLLAACATGAPKTVSFGELVAEPARYDGKAICTEGIYVTGFEVMALGEGTTERDGAIYLTEPAMWVEGAEVEIQGSCDEPLGYTFCPAQVCGRFEAGGGYGHLGVYDYQLRDGS